jgi:hypothetical protein
MKIILGIFNYYIIGKNKYNPIKVMPTTASANFAIKILDTFIQLNQRVWVWL